MSTTPSFNGCSPTWCPGCGNHGIGIALKTALTQMGHDPSSISIVFGIGCSGNMSDFFNAYSIHSLHGRSIPNAIGLKLANHKRQVIVVAGDGDCYGEGGNHLLHACRGNHDITVIIHDNRVYGLTTGQVSPRALKGYKSKSTPGGTLENPINPLSLAMIEGASFVAQSFAGDLAHVISTIKQGVSHKGFSLINILQPCVTFNKVNTYQYYLQRIYKLGADHDQKSFDLALKKTLEISDEKFPLGVIYEVNKPAYDEQLPQIKDKELVGKERFTDFQPLVDAFI